MDMMIAACAILLAQAAHSLSSRAKASGSLTYVTWTSALSHIAWAAAQGSVIWKIGEAMARGGDWWLWAAWYVFWATAGNVLAVWAAKRWIE